MEPAEFGDIEPGAAVIGDHAEEAKRLVGIVLFVGGDGVLVYARGVDACERIRRVKVTRALFLLFAFGFAVALSRLRHHGEQAVDVARQRARQPLEFPGRNARVRARRDAVGHAPFLRAQKRQRLAQSGAVGGTALGKRVEVPPDHADLPADAGVGVLDPGAPGLPVVALGGEDLVKQRVEVRGRQRRGKLGVGLTAEKMDVRALFRRTEPESVLGLQGFVASEHDLLSFLRN